MTMENPTPETGNYPPNVIYHAAFSFVDPAITKLIGSVEFRSFQDRTQETLFTRVTAGVQTIYDGRLVTSINFDQLKESGSGDVREFYEPTTLNLDEWLCAMGCAKASLLDARLTTRPLTNEEDTVETFTTQAREIINQAARRSINSTLKDLSLV